MNHRRKSILSLLLALVLLTGLLPVQAADTAPTEMQSGSLAMEKPTMADIQAKYATVTTAETRFDETPSVTAPYALGELSPSFLDSGLTYFNYIRYLAGLPAVQLSDEKNTAAQYGAVVMAANNELAHFPTRPEDMDDAFYQAGCAATSTSNISMRGTSSAGNLQLDVLQSAIAGQMSDSGSNNLSVLGHRRWLLNPQLLYTGFGCADAEFDGTYYRTYVDVPVFDCSGAAVDYNFVAWPASGNMPVQEFAITDPWSISLNPTKYAVPALEDLTVTLARVVDGKSCVFTSDTCPETPAEDGAYFTIDTRGYGEGDAIIFRPASDDFGSTQYGLGEYTVTVTGLTDQFGNAEALSYRVMFFDVEIGSAGQDIPSCSVYLSADGTDWVSEGLTCAYDGTAKEPLVIVCSDATKLTQDVDYTVTYEDNVEQGIASVVITGIGQYSGVKRVSFEINDPTHTHDFGSPTFIWSADNSACSAALTCSICDIVQTRPCTVTHTVTPATCTERGLEVSTASVTVGIRTYHTSRWTQLAALGHDWDSGVITTPATETETGVKTYTCTVCKATETEVIPATGEPPVASIDPCDIFKDVQHDWAYDGIRYCVNAGLMNGVGSGIFDPNGTLTRAMVVTILWRQAGEPEPTKANSFQDLKQDWYVKAVAWAAETGVVTGRSATVFDPECPISRQDMATILYRYTKQVLHFDVSQRANLTVFPDHGLVAAYAADAMAWANAAGLISGDSRKDGVYLDPQGNTTRAQAAAILMRFCKNVAN